LRLIATEPLLHRYGLAAALDGVHGQGARHLFFGRHGGATQRLADSLLHLHGHGGDLLDIQIAALGLLAEHVRPLVPQAPAPTAMRPADQERLLRARDILMSQFDRPLTIAYLCAAVGTNEFKLKQGFRALFGTSPHRMLTDIRMQKAWELLETGLHVATVAYRVGYQHPSSFSAAFERHHGRTPRSVAGPRTRR
jgi:AraC-like DNA-binding protein